MRSKRLYIAGCLAFMCATGCSTLKYADKLLILKSIGDSQKSMQVYVEKHEAFFDKLKEDLANGLLKRGTSKAEAIRVYGEPVLLTKNTGPEGGEVFLYRYPTNYFDSDRIYLYFDDSGSLNDWEYKPKNKP